MRPSPLVEQAKASRAGQWVEVGVEDRGGGGVQGR